MSTLIDETGNHYGKLIVLKRADENTSGGGAMWLCQCDCGKTNTVFGACLRRGTTKSCGCARTDRALPNGVAAFRKLLYTYKHHARSRGFEWKLSKEGFRELTLQPCHYCGAEPAQVAKPSTTAGDYVYNGIDRLDNAKGYVDGNVVSCCGTCNRMKMGTPYVDFMMQVARIYDAAMGVAR